MVAKACLKEGRKRALAPSLGPTSTAAPCTSSAAGGAQEEERAQILEDQPYPVVQSSMRGVVAAVVATVAGVGSHKNSMVWVARSLGPDLVLGEVAGNDIRAAVDRAAVASVGLGSHRKEQHLS